MELRTEHLQEAVHTALRAWHAQGPPPPTLLDELLLVRTRRMQNVESRAPALHLATNQVLLEALDELERQDATAGTRRPFATVEWICVLALWQPCPSRTRRLIRSSL